MATSKRSSSGYFLLIDGEGKTDKASMRHTGENAFKTAHPKFQKTIYFCFVNYAKAFDCVDRHKLWKIQEMGIPDHLTCFLRNLYAGQEAEV